MAAYLRLNRNILILTLIVLLAGACSTKKNTFTRRAYHNLSAHYNAWWNGNESLKEGVYQIGKSAKDNYISVLPVYNYGSQTVAQSVNPNMDRAIEKASKVIQKHSMFFNNKEYVKWVMNSYLMIGKANFYKQDYGAAKRAFEFVTTKYSYDPIRYEAQLWIAKTLQKQKQYEAALNVLNELTAESETILLPWKVRKALPMTYADIYIAQGKLALAREQIEAGLPLQSGSKFKTRLNFILGQIYQQEGKNSQATEYYTLAIKGTPSFEMAFNARINMARVYDAGRSDHRLIVRELEKMLKDAKNRDFQDQIYFALADIALKEKNDTLGISHLRKSVATSLDNDFQKSTSALKLADLYFNRQQYTFAGLYYDTAVNYLPKEFPDYENISKKTEIIGRLVKNLEIVQVQDSLQALAGMPQAERFAIIDKAIARYIEREEEIARKAEEEKMALEAGIALGGRRVTDMEGQTTVGGGGWYFYNPSAIGMGYSEFTRKWGRRRLEDNWRLSNKRVVDFDMIAENGEIADSLDIEGGEKASVTDLRSREAYLVNLPLTPEKVDASNVQIGQALFNAGLIYLEELNNVSEAEKTLNTLLTRFPSDTNALQAHYHLYRINRDLGDNEEMMAHQNLIIQDYPDSDYARILIDPGYKAELEEAKNRVRTLYEETYEAFSAGLYRMVILYSNEAISMYNGNDLIPQFTYLRALALGKTVNQDTMKVELAQLVKDFPSSTVIPYANIILGEQKTGAGGMILDPVSGDSIATNLDVSMYTYSPATSHFYVMIVDGNLVNVYGTKVRISDFNSRNYGTQNLQVNSVILEGNKQMISVSTFANSEDAMRFINHISTDGYVFSGIPDGSYDQFIISSNNYPVFFKEKKTAPYLLFFRNNYQQP